MSVSLNLQLDPAKPGLVWALWHIHKSKATGVLTIQWEKFKKQIVFRAGEAVASRSNWPHELLSNFLIRRKPEQAAELKAAFMEHSKLTERQPLGEYLVGRGLFDGAELLRMMEEHFMDRVFNLVGLTHGSVEFVTLQELPLKDVDQMMMREPLLKGLTDSVRLIWDEASSRSRLQGISGRPVRVRGDFALPLAAKELRVWNELQKDFRLLQKCDADALRLLALAQEFSALEIGESPVEKLKKELDLMSQKFSKATYPEILGVSPQASIDECKTAYLGLIKKFHPDRLPADAGPELRKVCESVFSKINEAHSTLIDPERRTEYHAKVELDKAGGMEMIEKTLEAEMLIPQAKASLKRKTFRVAMDQFAQIMKVLKKDPEIEADYLFAQFMNLVEAKVPFKSRVQEFTQGLTQTLSRRENYGAAYYYRGMIYKLDGQVDKALEDFDSAVEYDSSLTEAVSEARVLRMRKDSGSKKSGLFGKKS